MSPRDDAHPKTRPTFAAVPEWVLLSDVSPAAKSLYGVLLAHVNRERGDHRCWPSTEVLAKMMGFSRRQSVAPYVAELVDLRAIEVDMNTASSRRNHRYVVHEKPPQGHTGPVSIAAWYQQHYTEMEKSADARANADTYAGPSADPYATADANQTNATHTNAMSGTTPSGEHVAAAAPAARGDRPPKIMLHTPDDIDTYSPGRTAKYVMSAGAAAVKAVGLTWSELGRKRFGRSAKDYVEQGGSPRRVVLLAGRYLQTAVVGGEHAWLLDSPRPSVDADPDDFMAWAEMKADIEEWKLEKFGEDFTPAEEGCATRMWVEERPMQAIERKLRKMVRDDQAGPARREREWTRKHAVYSVSCDECGWPEGRLCRDVDNDGQPLPRTCHPCRFVDAGVEPGAA